MRKTKTKRLLSLLICLTLLATSVFDGALAYAQVSTTGKSVTVSTDKEFDAAMNDKTVTEIIVTKRITLCGTAESSDYSISPVMIRGGVTIKGNKDGILTFRSPMQLQGDNVTFQNIEMNFISSGALNSVPHREIFLAGHTLTLDNVSCYTKGADGSLGGFGGNESALLPTVYAGAYRGTQASNNAGLTVNNANDKTIIQAIHAGHDKGNDNKIPYTGKMSLNLDAKTTVVDGIFSSLNTENVAININGQNQNSCRIKGFDGNQNTTITLDNVAVNQIPVKGGNFVLNNNAVFEPVAKGASELDSVTVSQGAILNLVYMPNTTIKGSFTGGGTLILDKDDVLTINGQVSGSTTFKTWSGTIGGAGQLTDNHGYIACQKQETADDFKLDSSYQNYSFALVNNLWTVTNNAPEDKVFGSFEILSGPKYVDYDVVTKETLDGKGYTQIFNTQTKDQNGEIYVPYGGFYTYVIKESDIKNDSETNWGTDIFAEPVVDEYGDFLNKYYICFGTVNNTDTVPNTENISDKIKPNQNYKVYFTEQDCSNATVGEIKNAARGSADFYLFQNKSDVSKTSINDATIEKISEQKYTGMGIEPKVTVNLSGGALTEGQDYIVEYNNNVNVTSELSKAQVVVKGINNYQGEAIAEFTITKGDVKEEGAITAGQAAYTYGDIAKIYFNVHPTSTGNSGAVQTVKTAGTLGAAGTTTEGTVSFYDSNTNELLGSANVVNGKAICTYNTSQKKIATGSVSIRAEFSGNDQLNGKSITAQNVFTLNKKTLDSTNISSLMLKDFVYDGTKNTTEVIGITWNDPVIEGLNVTGKATLSSVDAGTYDAANITDMKVEGTGTDWYDVTALQGTLSNVNISPQVTISKAPSVGTVTKTQNYTVDQTSGSLQFDNIIPLGYQVKSVEEGDNTGYGGLISNVQVNNSGVSYDLVPNSGQGKIQLRFIFKNHEDMILEINVIKTGKTVLSGIFTAPSVEYNGALYDGWTVNEGYDKNFVTATYFNRDNGTKLNKAPKDVGNYSVKLHFENEKEIAEDTLDFQINKKSITLKALDKQIKIGEAVPDLSNPQKGVDYSFQDGDQVQGDSLGVIKMVYDKTPDTSKAGNYKIQIGILGSSNENYNISFVEGNLTISGEETKPPVTEPEKPPVTEPEKPPVTEPEKPPVTEPEKPPVTPQPPTPQPPAPPVPPTPEKPPVTEPEKPPVTEPEKPPVTEPEKPPVTEPEKPPVGPLASPGEVKVTMTQSGKIKVTWDNVKGAESYEIYRSIGNGVYKKIAVVDGKNYFYDKNKVTGKRYSYKVIACRDGEKSEFSDTTTVVAKPSTPIMSLKVKKNKVTISWPKVKNADGYQIYRATKKGKYYRVASISSRKNVFINKGLKKGKTYYYKIRSYERVNGKKVFSGFSKVKVVRVK